MFLRLVLAAVLAVSLLSPVSAQVVDPVTASCNVPALAAIKEAAGADAQDDNFQGATDKLEQVVAGFAACAAHEPDRAKQLVYRFNMALAQASVALTTLKVGDMKRANESYRSAMTGFSEILADSALTDDGREFVTSMAKRVYETCAANGLTLSDNS